jgi:uncharacterized membrane protein
VDNQGVAGVRAPPRKRTVDREWAVLRVSAPITINDLLRSETTSRAVAVIPRVLLAAGLRFWSLSRTDIWLDEANGILLANLGVAELLARLRLDSNPPLYYLLLRVWMGISRDSEAAVRSLSAVAGVLLNAGACLAGRRFFGAAAGRGSGLLTALSPVQVLYSQQVRMYSLLALLALVVADTLETAIRTGSRRSRVVLAAALVAALHTHNHGVFLLPDVAAALLLTGDLRRHPGRWLVVAGVVGVAYAPNLPLLRDQLANPGH